MTRRRRALAFIAVLALAGCSTKGCGRDRNGSKDPSLPGGGSTALVEVALPDLSRADEAVQLQARQLHDALLVKVKAGVKGAELGAAYGELGMLLHAAEYFDSAGPCYRNAQVLMPGDARWPYYLGLLFQARGQTPAAEAAFARALEIEPNDVAALIRLGRMRLDRGDAAGAEQLFARARATAPGSIAALAGLGSAALALQQYERAVQYLEEGLASDPGSLSLHAPLANAYRALGKLDRAETHIKQWRNTEIVLQDPRKDELDGRLQSGLSYELRGVRALGVKDWKGAAALFREGIRVSRPGSPMQRSLHHKLGTALWMSGDTRGALAEFREVVRLAPASGSDEPAAKAFYSLGIVAASEGHTQEAVEHFSAAVRYQPNYVEAHLALGDAHRSLGRFAESLSSYRETVNLNPQAAAARFGYAMSLVRLGRYVEARDWLIESLRIQPDRPELANALARLLAAAPDERVRNGREALSLAGQLAASQKTTEVGETMAMAYAEVGDFAQAVAVQREVLDAARKAGFIATAARLSQNLRLYERGQPCRTPWRNDDPVHMPGAPAA
jgi:tetratricopeptide (TPR) repeat protein